MKTEMLHGMLDIVDMEGVLTGDEEHVSGWDLVYDNGYIEIDPGLSSFPHEILVYYSVLAKVKLENIFEPRAMWIHVVSRNCSA